MPFKEVLSDWNKDIIFGLPDKKCPEFLFNYHELLDDSYIQYYFFYLASKGRFTKEIMKLSSEELLNEVEILFKGDS